MRMPRTIQATNVQWRQGDESSGYRIQTSGALVIRGERLERVIALSSKVQAPANAVATMMTYRCNAMALAAPATPARITMIGCGSCPTRLHNRWTTSAPMPAPTSATPTKYPKNMESAPAVHHVAVGQNQTVGSEHESGTAALLHLLPAAGAADVDRYDRRADQLDGVDDGFGIGIENLGFAGVQRVHNGLDERKGGEDP